MAVPTKTPQLWTPRSVDDTQKIYADWADTYESDVTAMAYATPDRIAAALVEVGADPAGPVLDFGCGTGLSGVALRAKGFDTLDGTDISPQMLTHAQAKTWHEAPLYRRCWLGDVGSVAAKPGDYAAIVATGVISLGAAPPEMLNVLLAALAPGALLAFSYNDPTLAHHSYIAALEDCLTRGAATLEFRQHGPHLNATVTGSDVIVLRRK